MSKKVLKHMLEIHKPSSQITCIYEKNGKPTTLQPFQHDVMNFFCYKMREYIMLNHELEDIIASSQNDDELFNFLRVQKVNIKYDEIIEFTKKFTAIENRKNMIQTIKELQHIIVNVGQFKSDELMTEDSFPLISRVSKITNSKELTIWLEPELILGWVFNAKPFAKLHLKIQTTLGKTYTKILYEICKDYFKLGYVTKSFELWKQVLHLKGENVSRLKVNYLNKAIEEINSKTDIKITNIYSKKDNNVTTMTVEFEKQSEERLIELGLVQESIESHKFYNKSKSKLDKLVAHGYQLIDEEMWITTDINKNESRYDAEMRIDQWLDETSIDDKNSVYEKLASSIDDCDDPMVYIDSYKIIGLYSKDAFTKNPNETIAMLNSIIAEMINPG